MKTRFDFGGYEFVVTDNGQLSSERGQAVSAGRVGFQLVRTGVDPLGTKSEAPETVAEFFLDPSHARAVASAFLSAAGTAAAAPKLR